MALRFDWLVFGLLLSCSGCDGKPARDRAAAANASQVTEVAVARPPVSDLTFNPRLLRRFRPVRARFESTRVPRTSLG